MVNTSEEEGHHLNGCILERLLRTEDNVMETEDTDVHGTGAVTPPIVIRPFTLKEKFLALDDTQAKGLKRLRSDLMRMSS
jgi:hypothetical protein